MSRTITLAVGQFSSQIGKLDENLSAALRLSAEAVQRGARFILFPEDCLTGYPSIPGSAKDVAVEVDDAIAKRLSEAARDLGLSIAAGIIERHNNRFHASHLIAFDNGTRHIIRKRSVDDRDARIGLVASDDVNDDFDIDGAKTAMAICMDGTDPFFDDAAKRNVRIILHPSGGACAQSARRNDEDASVIDACEKENCRRCLAFAQERARDLNAVYCVANSVGFDGERGCPGNSWIISPAAEVLAYLPGTAIIEEMREGIAIATSCVS
jgi:predicted amidohydrolase